MTEKELFAAAIEAEWLAQKDAVRAGARARAAALPGTMKGTIKMKKKISTLALAAALTCLLAITVGAVWLLSARDVAKEFGYDAVAAAFEGANAVTVNETQEENGYRVSFLGITSGESLAEYTDLEGNGLSSERSYAVTAVSRADGTPLTQEDGGGLILTPLIGGLDSRLYNIFSMDGSVTWNAIDGVLYFLTECDSVEIFADRPLYLAVMDGFVPTEAEYVMDAATGEYAPNADYAGLNLLFRLPIDASRADSAAAEAYRQVLEG